MCLHFTFHKKTEPRQTDFINDSDWSRKIRINNKNEDVTNEKLVKISFVFMAINSSNEKRVNTSFMSEKYTWRQTDGTGFETKATNHVEILIQKT